MTTHPLDPATADEIERAVDLFRTAHGSDAWFSSCGRVEPGKAALKAWQEGNDPLRVIRLLGVDRSGDGGFEADVALADGSVQVRRLPLETQTPYGFADFAAAIRLTKAHKGWLSAAEKRGVAVATKDDLERIQIDPWPAGGYPHPDIPQGHRAFRCIAFVRDDPKDNGYAHPIQGLIAHVDVTAGTVVAVEDSGVVPVPQTPGRFDSAHQGATREGLRELEITQPDGPSFEVDGYRVRWQGYDFRVSIHPTHGLVLHGLSLNERPLLFRAALSDMVVPYGDSDPMHSWKHVLDASEYNLGTAVNSLTLGCDCLGEIYYFDIHHVTWDGKVRPVKNAICLHEEDYGIQWKHFDAQSETTEVRRSRRLVISSVFTIGNYDYGFYWYLYLDGTIQMEIKLTGIVGVSAVEDRAVNPEQSPLIAPNIVSPVHQHLFSFRLDWELDGGTNALYESEIEALPLSDDNPDGTQFRSVARHLTTESQAMRDTSPQTSRTWKVVNPERLNGLGEPVAYKLLPGPSPLLFARPESAVAKRAAFATHHLWATPYADGEESAAGPYTVMHAGEGGLTDYTAADRSIAQCDLVMWHTVGVTHVPRPEDWPVMPVEYCGFHLVPVGFFDRNPTLDLPSHCHS